MSLLPPFLHKDHLGSVRAISGADGTPEERTLYRPYGAQSEVVTATLNDDKSWLGERYDAGAGLQYLNARYYDPELAMFYQPDWFDPTDPMVGTSRYAYGLGNPIGYRDPTGNRNDNEGDHGNVDETGGSGTGSGDSPVGGGGNASVGGSPVGGTPSGGGGDDRAGGSGAGGNSSGDSGVPPVEEILPYTPTPVAITLAIVMNPKAQKFARGFLSFPVGLARCVMYCGEGAAVAEKAVAHARAHPSQATAAAKHVAEKAAENAAFVTGRVSAAVGTGAVAGVATLGATKSPTAAKIVGSGVYSSLTTAAALGDLGYKSHGVKEMGLSLPMREVLQVLTLGE